MAYNMKKDIFSVQPEPVERVTEQSDFLNIDAYLMCPLTHSRHFSFRFAYEKPSGQRGMDTFFYQSFR